MKRPVFGFMSAALLTLSLSVVARATTTDELIISSGSFSCTIVDNAASPTGTCGSITKDSDSSDGTDTTGGMLNGWTITVTSGTSYSPDTDPALDLASVTAKCASGACTGANSLTIVYTDMNFTGSGRFKGTFSDSQSADGTATQSAYYSSTNALDTPTTQIGTIITFNNFPGGASVVSGGTAPSSPYSLTLVQNFSTTNKTTLFSVDGLVSAVPEGWSLSSALGMLGFGVVALVVARRRGLVKTTV